MLKTYVYIDGFNLYYGALKKTPYRWLDLAQLCKLMLPTNDVQRINYYTARVGARIGDPAQPTRQHRYLRALGTLPQVHVHFGHYLSHGVWMPVERPLPAGPKFVRVIKTEEKGSDVNLATHLVSDAYENKFDVAVLVTNDSDLKEPVDLVRSRLGKKVGVLNPQKHRAVALTKVATFFKTIRSGVLQASQFPEQLTDSRGTFDNGRVVSPPRQDLSVVGADFGALDLRVLAERLDPCEAVAKRPPEMTARRRARVGAT